MNGSTDGNTAHGNAIEAGRRGNDDTADHGTAASTPSAGDRTLGSPPRCRDDREQQHARSRRRRGCACCSAAWLGRCDKAEWSLIFPKARHPARLPPGVPASRTPTRLWHAAARRGGPLTGRPPRELTFPTDARRRRLRRSAKGGRLTEDALSEGCSRPFPATNTTTPGG
jgi:hypothetical protein